MADLLTARAQTARECAAFYVGELGHASVRDEEAAVRDLTARTLEPGGPFDALCAAYDAELADLHARLVQCERERDEAREATVFAEKRLADAQARITRLEEVVTAHTHEANHQCDRIATVVRERDEARALAALVTTYRAAEAALTKHAPSQLQSGGHWCDECRRLVGVRDRALAALRGETPADEGGGR